MLKVKDIDSKVTARKRNINISNVAIVDGELVDEQGSIGVRLKEALPSTMETFDLKITVELPSEDDDDADVDSIF